MLPAAVRTELDRRIVERAFSGYHALAEWLQAQGYQIADDSVQRYGARLRRQLEALDFARHQAAALAAAGHRADDTAETLTAVTVQLIQQQVLSILLQTAQLESVEPANTGEAGNTADYDEAERAPREGSAAALTNAELKRLDVSDLIRLTRITVDLNRIAKARHQRAEHRSSRRRHKAADQPPAEPQDTDLSEEAYQAIRTAMRDNPPVRSPAVPSELGETPVESTQPVSNVRTAAEAQQSAAMASQPRLTADGRSYPHQKLHRIPADALTGVICPSLAGC
jgi:hypothetical protein